MSVLGLLMVDVWVVVTDEDSLKADLGFPGDGPVRSIALPPAPTPTPLPAAMAAAAVVDVLVTSSPKDTAGKDLASPPPGTKGEVREKVLAVLVVVVVAAAAGGGAPMG